MLTRREALLVGGLAGLRLSLPKLLSAESGGRNTAGRGPAAAKSCILFFMEGGPSHIDLWDMKPAAPREVRGEFRPAATNVPGISVCEHLPMLAQRADKYAIVRGITHNVADHGRD